MSISYNILFFLRCVVWTGDNRVFFFNPSTKTSLWECPPELKNRPEVQELMKASPKAKDPNQSVKRTTDDETPEESNKKLK